jgi:hypothetical protein
MNPHPDPPSPPTEITEEELTVGKAIRNRKRRGQSTGQPSTASSDPASWQHWLPEGPLDGHDPQTQALLARLATEHHMPCKLTYLDDPVFGRGTVPLADITEDGTLIRTSAARWIPSPWSCSNRPGA